MWKKISQEITLRLLREYDLFYKKLSTYKIGNTKIRWSIWLQICFLLKCSINCLQLYYYFSPHTPCIVQHVGEGTTTQGRGSCSRNTFSALHLGFSLMHLLQGMLNCLDICNQSISMPQSYWWSLPAIPFYPFYRQAESPSKSES